MCFQCLGFCRTHLEIAIFLIIYCQCLRKIRFFSFWGGGGGSGNNDHGFPFFGDVELVEPSLRAFWKHWRWTYWTVPKSILETLDSRQGWKLQKNSGGKYWKYLPVHHYFFLSTTVPDIWTSGIRKVSDSPLEKGLKYLLVHHYFYLSWTDEESVIFPNSIHASHVYLCWILVSFLSIFSFDLAFFCEYLCVLDWAWHFQVQSLQNELLITTDKFTLAFDLDMCKSKTVLEVLPWLCLFE